MISATQLIVMLAFILPQLEGKCPRQYEKSNKGYMERTCVTLLKPWYLKVKEDRANLFLYTIKEELHMHIIKLIAFAYHETYLKQIIYGFLKHSIMIKTISL